MTGAPADRRPAPWPVVLVALVLVAVIGWWLITRTNVSPQARECGERYRAARTAADSAAVDSLVPPSGDPGHTCGMMRTNARW